MYVGQYVGSYYITDFIAMDIVPFCQDTSVVDVQVRSSSVISPTAFLCIQACFYTGVVDIATYHTHMFMYPRLLLYMCSRDCYIHTCLCIQAFAFI